MNVRRLVRKIVYSLCAGGRDVGGWVVAVSEILKELVRAAEEQVPKRKHGLHRLGFKAYVELGPNEAAAVKFLWFFSS